MCSINKHLEKRIEELRQDLNAFTASQERGFKSSKAYKMSLELDKLITKYMKESKAQ